MGRRHRTIVRIWYSNHGLSILPVISLITRVRKSLTPGDNKYSTQFRLNSGKPSNDMFPVNAQGLQFQMQSKDFLPACMHNATTIRLNLVTQLLRHRIYRNYLNVDESAVSKRTEDEEEMCWGFSLDKSQSVSQFLWFY